MEEVTLFVAYIAPSTNAMYAGQHWTKRKKHKKAAAAAVDSALLGKNIEPFSAAAVITVIPYLGKGRRGYDVSNYSYTLKLIEDCLVSRGIITDDTADKVGEIRIKSPRRSGGVSGVEVTLSEMH